jgi:hypothetical protein
LNIKTESKKIKKEKKKKISDNYFICIFFIYKLRNKEKKTVINKENTKTKQKNKRNKK